METSGGENSEISDHNIHTNFNFFFLASFPFLAKLFDAVFFFLGGVFSGREEFSKWG